MMKKQSDHPINPPSPEQTLTESGPLDTLKAPLANALDPSEITLMLMELETPPENPEPETSTIAIPIKDLGKTADIAPVLLPGSLPQPQTAPAPVPAQSTATTIPPSLAAPKSRSGTLWLGVAACLLLGVAGVGYWVLRPDPVEVPVADATPLSSPQPPSEVVAPELRAYMDQARGGDAKAMHMMALMYWNGLNIRQDRVKGLEWYRKAVMAGDKAAQKELNVIEGK